MLSSEHVRGFPVALAATCSDVWYILVRYYGTLCLLQY